MLSIAIGADDAAIELKELIINHLHMNGVTTLDFSRHPSPDTADYPDIAFLVAQAILSGQHQRGILICGTGIGMSIVANKVAGIRAAQCHDTYSAERARKSNNAQIITLGARVIGPELAKKIIDTWLASEFEGGGSTVKVEKIGYYERQRAGSSRKE